MASRDQRRQAAGAPPDGTAARPGPTDVPGPSAPTLRRRHLLGAAGVTAVSLATMVPAARAQSQNQTPPGSTPGTTPGAAPTGTTPGTTPAASGDAGEEPQVEGPDLELVRFARSVELALEQVYEQAIDSGRLKTKALDLAHLCHDNHREHAERMAELGGSQAPNSPNRGLLASLAPRVAAAGDEAALIGVLESMEDSAAATYLTMLGTANDWQLATTFATIAPVDAQQVVAWNRVRFADAPVWAAQVGSVLPANETADGSWSPLQYPVGPA